MLRANISGFWHITCWPFGTAPIKWALFSATCLRYNLPFCYPAGDKHAYLSSSVEMVAQGLLKRRMLVRSWLLRRNRKNAYRNLPYELRPEEKYRQVPLKPRARKQCWRYGYFQIDFGVKITHQKCKDIKCNIYLKITLIEAYMLSSPIPSASTSTK